MTAWVIAPESDDRDGRATFLDSTGSYLNFINVVVGELIRPSLARGAEELL